MISSQQQNYMLQPKSHDIGELVALLPKEYQIPLTVEEQAKASYYAIAGRYPVDGCRTLLSMTQNLRYKWLKKLENMLKKSSKFEYIK